MNLEPPSFRKLFKFLFLFGVLGAIVTCGLLYVERIGIYEKWSLLTRLPDDMVELVSGYRGGSIMRSSQGKLYACSEGEQVCTPTVIIEGLEAFEAQPCDYTTLPFMRFTHPPQTIADCVHLEGGYIHTSMHIELVIDQDHNLWQWMSTDSAYDLFMIPLLTILGGLGGVLLGTVFWTFRLASQSKTVPAQMLFPKPHIWFLLLPWLVLLLGVLFYNNTFYPPARPLDPQTAATYTAYALEDGPLLTAVEQKWLVEATPNPNNPKYDFVQGMCSAAWNTQWYDPVACQDGMDLSGDMPLGKLTNPTLQGVLLEGDAIGIRITSEETSMTGAYPTMEIQAGDHFKATIGCQGRSAACDLLFIVSYQTQGNGSSELGRWMVMQDGQPEEIDIDLSTLAGQKVRFMLYIFGFEDHKAQYPVWFKPRIEGQAK